MTRTPYVAQDAYQLTEFEFEIKKRRITVQIIYL